MKRRAKDGTGRPQDDPPPRGTSARSEFEALVELGAAFEEACDHAARQKEFRDLRWGPRTELSLGEVRPGEFGTARSVWTGDGELLGRIVHLTLASGLPPRSVATAPLPTVPSEDLAAEETLSGPPRQRLLAHSPLRAERARLGRLVHAIARELRQEE